GIKLLDVQYKGAAPAVIDLVGGHVMVRFDQVTTSLHHIRDGKLRALAVTTLKRSAVLPEVPTVHESALPGFSDSTFNGLVAKAAAGAELRKRFGDQGIELVASHSADEFAAFLRKQAREFAVLAKQAGITVN